MNLKIHYTFEIDFWIVILKAKIFKKQQVDDRNLYFDKTN